MLEEMAKIVTVLVPTSVFTLLVLGLVLSVVKSMVTDVDAAYERPATRAERQRNLFGLPDYIARCVIDLGEIGSTYELCSRCVDLWCPACGMPRCSQGSGVTWCSLRIDSRI
jgi:hypothetical protein